MRRSTMYSQQADDNREKLVVPLFEIVVYPKSRTKLMADKVTGEILLNEMKSAEFVNAVGLTVKNGTKASDLSEDSLYKIGNLLKITFVQPADDGYLVIAKAIERVEAVSLYRREGLFYATYRSVYDLPDFDEDAEAEVMEKIKKTIHEISNRFQGSEQFTRPIDKMDSIDQIMGFVMPYMPVKLAEKQKLLELASVRERYLLFLHILTKQKENINLQIEMAKKVTDKISKSNREAML
ncbi:MAG TPA: LON peptidase substrate-binding domain-containing protein, partial [Methanosarcina sp.]|nr:LON peptidase substrate-binding domain-containing protein [Methanosarcina sp.]